MLKIPTKLEIKAWWKVFSVTHAVSKNSGTWVHRAAFVVHFLAKLTAFIPSFKKKIKPQKTKLNLELKQKLQDKLDLYKKLIIKHQDSHGFIFSDKCDSLLFSSLISTTGIPVDIEAAKDDLGFYHRRSREHPECYPDSSKSSFSRDMLTGLLWHFWHNNSHANSYSFYDTMKKHNYVMGLGDPARLIMMPSLEATLAQICKIQGKSNWTAHWLACRQIQAWPKNLTGYEAHLLILHSLLSGKVLGHVDNSILNAYKTYASKNPNNALHQFAYKLYTDGDLSNVAQLLLNEQWWPNNRLPTKKDRQGEWLVADDDDHVNWLPGSEDLEKEHPGGDFIFVAWLVLSSLRE